MKDGLGSFSASAKIERKKRCTSRFREDVGDAHLLEPRLLHDEEGVEQRIRLGSRSWPRCGESCRPPRTCASANGASCACACRSPGRALHRNRRPDRRRARCSGSADAAAPAADLRPRRSRPPGAPATSRSISGRARRMACVTTAMSAAVAEAANDAVIAGKLPLAWCPPMKRAMRNGPRRTISSASANTGCPSSVSVTTR